VATKNNAAVGTPPLQVECCKNPTVGRRRYNWLVVMNTTATAIDNGSIAPFSEIHLD